MPTRLFLDANTIISGLLFEGNESELLDLGLLGAVELVTVAYVWAEVQEVLRRPQFRLSPEGVEDLLSFGQEALLILPDADEGAITSREGDLKDKEDAAVWAGFEASGADSLITGDKELLQKVRGARRTRTVLDDLRAGRLRPGKEDPPPSP